MLLNNLFAEHLYHILTIKRVLSLNFLATQFQAAQAISSYHKNHCALIHRLGFYDLLKAFLYYLDYQ